MQVARSAKSKLIPSRVTELEITRLLNLRESKSFLKKRLEQIESELSEHEDEIIEQIEQGAIVTSEYAVGIKVSERRYPSWKDAFIQIAGEREAKKITDSTAPTISKSIVVSAK